MDLYETLGVARDATRETIRKAFRRRARQTHPDAGGVAEDFHAVELAHRVLIDDKRRARYDADGSIDDQVDTLESEAMSIIGRMIETIVADEGAKHRDLVADMKRALDVEIAQARRSREDGEHFIVRTQNLRTRLKGGKGRALIDGMLARKIDQAKVALDALARQIEVREMAQKLIDDASFEPESRVDAYANYFRTAESMKAQMEQARMQQNIRSSFFGT
jgi:curved DNA-binding protein CbpA